jgi:hypothetical protein
LHHTGARPECYFLKMLLRCRRSNSKARVGSPDQAAVHPVPKSSRRQVPLPGAAAAGSRRQHGRALAGGPAPAARSTQSAPPHALLSPLTLDSGLRLRVSRPRGRAGGHRQPRHGRLSPGRAETGILQPHSAAGCCPSTDGELDGTRQCQCLGVRPGLRSRTRRCGGVITRLCRESKPRTDPTAGGPGRRRAAPSFKWHTVTVSSGSLWQ